MTTKMPTYVAGPKPGTVGQTLKQLTDLHDLSLAASLPLYVPKLQTGWGKCTIHAKTSRFPGRMEWAV